MSAAVPRARGAVISAATWLRLGTHAMRSAESRPSTPLSCRDVRRGFASSSALSSTSEPDSKVRVELLLCSWSRARRSCSCAWECAQAPADKRTDGSSSSPSDTGKVSSDDGKRGGGKKTPPADREEYRRRLEERFGGGEASTLGQLNDRGQPEGLGKHTSRNMYRII